MGNELDKYIEIIKTQSGDIKRLQQNMESLEKLIEELNIGPEDIKSLKCDVFRLQHWRQYEPKMTLLDCIKLWLSGKKGKGNDPTA